MKEPTITITVSDYNKLVNLQYKRHEVIPSKVSLKSNSNILIKIRRCIATVLTCKKNFSRPKLIRFCIHETCNFLDKEIMGYWGGSINEDMKEHFREFQSKYEREVYDKIIAKLNK